MINKPDQSLYTRSQWTYSPRQQSVNQQHRSVGAQWLSPPPRLALILGKPGWTSVTPKTINTIPTEFIPNNTTVSLQYLTIITRISISTLRLIG